MYLFSYMYLFVLFYLTIYSLVYFVVQNIGKDTTQVPKQLTCARYTEYDYQHYTLKVDNVIQFKSCKIFLTFKFLWWLVFRAIGHWSVIVAR